MTEPRKKPGGLLGSFIGDDDWAAFTGAAEEAKTALARVERKVDLIMEALGLPPEGGP